MKIKLHTWYQERGGIEEEEILPNEFDHYEDVIDWLHSNKKELEMYPIVKIEIGTFEEKKESKLSMKYAGDTVYMDCLSSMGASSAGDIKITKVLYRYDEKTGEKYKVLVTDGGGMYDSRDGSPMNNQSMYYIV